MPTSFNSDTSSVSDKKGGLRIEQRPGHWLGYFHCMASPCEILVASNEEPLARRIISAIVDEAYRIERTYSRYRDDNIIYRINTAEGRPVDVDDELAGLLDFATTCWKISNGKFDITSGVLRRAWCFDGHSAIPDEHKIRALLPLVGWDKVSWPEVVQGAATGRRQLRMPTGMEIDLGGIGKEYAVDRAAGIAAEHGKAGVLVNFGGDIRATGPHLDGSPWQVGIEAVSEHDEPPPVISISRGAIATSGDARRYVLHKGKRYGHILDPHTGWPIQDAPRSVTVLDDSCTQAGLLATLAMLQGAHAERFLASQAVDFKILR